MSSDKMSVGHGVYHALLVGQRLVRADARRTVVATNLRDMDLADELRLGALQAFHGVLRFLNLSRHALTEEGSRQRLGRYCVTLSELELGMPTSVPRWEALPLSTAMAFATATPSHGSNE